MLSVLCAHHVADFLAFQDEGVGDAVQQQLVPLVAESAASLYSRRLCARMRAKATSACNSMRSPHQSWGRDSQRGPNTDVVLRARDAQKLARAKCAVDDRLERVRLAKSNSS